MYVCTYTVVSDASACVCVSVCRSGAGECGAAGPAAASASLLRQPADPLQLPERALRRPGPRARPLGPPRHRVRHGAQVAVPVAVPRQPAAARPVLLPGPRPRQETLRQLSAADGHPAVPVTSLGGRPGTDRYQRHQRHQRHHRWQHQQQRSQQYADRANGRPRVTTRTIPVSPRETCSAR